MIVDGPGHHYCSHRYVRARAHARAHGAEIYPLDHEEGQKRCQPALGHSIDYLRLSGLSTPSEDRRDDPIL